MKNIFSATTYQSQFFEIAHELSKGIDYELLSDPENPIIVTIDGDHGTGKKIFPDTVRNSLIHRQKHFEGRENFDEYWTGTTKSGLDIEINFINPLWSTPATNLYSTEYWSDLNRRKDTPDPEQLKCSLVDRFLKMRQLGGISFIHNHAPLMPEPADIQITVKTDKSLRKNNSAYGFAHPRYLTIQINKRDILSTPQMQQALSRLNENSKYYMSDDALENEKAYRLDEYNRDNVPTIRAPLNPQRLRKAGLA